MSSAGRPTGGTTYARAGVDTGAGDRAVELMKESVARTQGTEVLGGIGGFAGLYDASALKSYRRPLLATSTDGVGTKVAIAQAMDIHGTIGFDLVAMVVDDIVVCGARPLMMTDYIACGKVVPERIAAIVRGIAQACEVAGCALVGGETAEHPGLLGADEYDVAGAATGVVEADDLLGPERVEPGDVAVALGSSGLHSNGYSLVRRVFADAGWSLQRHVDDLGRPLGEELLTPTAVYAADILDLLGHPPAPRTLPPSRDHALRARNLHEVHDHAEGVRAEGVRVDVHALAHVTGGGLAANLARVLPAGLEAVIDRGTWTPAPIFALVRDLGAVPQADLERTLNLGVGMVALVPGAQAGTILDRLARRGVAAWVAGEVRSAPPAGDPQGTGGVTRGAKGAAGGQVRLVGSHPAWL